MHPKLNRHNNSVIVAADHHYRLNMHPTHYEHQSSSTSTTDQGQKMAWSPQPQYHTSYQQHQMQQQQRTPPPTHHQESYYTNSSNFPSFSTPRVQVQSEPPTSPPRIHQEDSNTDINMNTIHNNNGGTTSISGAPSNLSMMNSIEETSSTIMEQPSASTIKKKMVMFTSQTATAAAASSSTNHAQNNINESITAEHREEAVIDRRTQSHNEDDEDDLMSRVASPTPTPRMENLPPKKRKAMSKESVLVMEIEKLKSDLSKATLRIQVLEEENERLRVKCANGGDEEGKMSSCGSSGSQLPFIPDLPGQNGTTTTTTSPDKTTASIPHETKQHKTSLFAQAFVTQKQQQQLHSIYRVPSSPSSLQRHFPPDFYTTPPPQFQRDGSHPPHHNHHRRPLPYHPYPPATTAAMSMDKYDRQHIHRERRDWAFPPPTNSAVETSGATNTSTNGGIASSESQEAHKKISFAFSFDANTKSGGGSSSMKESRGYNRCVSNRGRGNRPPLASRWKSR